MNRKMMEVLNNSNIFNKPKIYLKHLDIIDKHFEEMNSNDNICLILPDIIKQAASGAIVKHRLVELLRPYIISTEQLKQIQKKTIMKFLILLII